MLGKIGLVYRVAAYAVFLATMLYLVMFVAGKLDSGPAEPLSRTLSIDLALVALFGVQHSVMARESFKKWWTQ